MTIADLIGEVDPIKLAEGRYLSDELTMHYGLIPRTNRGSSASTSSPTSPTIQVGLFNVLEERDVQIRGYPIRLTLDLCWSSRPTPRTTPTGSDHHPAEGPDRLVSSDPTTRSTSTTEVAIVRAGGRARSSVGGRATCTMPGVPRARSSPRCQPPRPGEHPRQPAQRRQSVRLSVEQPRGRSSPTPLRRALRCGERVVVPRVGDLEALAASHERQDRDRVARRRARRRDPREPRARAPCSPCSRSG